MTMFLISLCIFYGPESFFFYGHESFVIITNVDPKELYMYLDYYTLFTDFSYTCAVNQDMVVNCVTIVPLNDFVLLLNVPLEVILQNPDILIVNSPEYIQLSVDNKHLITTIDFKYFYQTPSNISVTSIQNYAIVSKEISDAISNTDVTKISLEGYNIITRDASKDTS